MPMPNGDCPQQVTRQDTDRSNTYITTCAISLNGAWQSMRLERNIDSQQRSLTTCPMASGCYPPSALCHIGHIGHFYATAMASVVHSRSLAASSYALSRHSNTLPGSNRWEQLQELQLSSSTPTRVSLGAGTVYASAPGCSSNGRLSTSMSLFTCGVVSTA